MRALLPQLRRYRVALAATAGALVMTFLFGRLGGPVPFAFFIAAVLLSAWHGGLLPGLAATGLGFLALLLLHAQAPTLVAAATDFDYGPRLAMFVLIGLLASYLCKLCRRAVEAVDWIQATLFSIGDAIALTDADGHITHLNAAAQELTGWSSEEADGQPLDLVFHLLDEETRQPLEPAAVRAVSADAVTRSAGTALLQHREGGARAVEQMAAPIHDADGTVLGAILLCRDVSEQRAADRHLRDSEEKFRTLATCAPAGVLLLDAAGRCIFTNASCQALCGFTLEESLGEGWARAIHPEDRDWVVTGWVSAARALQPYYCQFRCRTAEGEVRWLQLRSAPRHAGHAAPVGHVGIVEDITAFKHAEEAMREGHGRWQQDAVERQRVEDALQVARERQQALEARHAELMEANLSLQARAQDQERNSHHEVQRRVAERTSDLSRAHDDLLRQVQEHHQTHAELRRQLGEHQQLHADLRRQLGEHQQLHADLRRQLDEHQRNERDKIERHVEERTAELARGSATLREQLHQREQAGQAEFERRLAEQTADLRAQLEARRQAGREEIDRRVEKRTAELSTAYAQLEQQLHVRQQTEEELRTTLQRLQALFDNTPAALYLKDAEGRFLLANRAFRALFHLNKKQIENRRAGDLFPRDLAELFQKHDRQAFAAREPLPLEEALPHEHGPRTLLTFRAPVHDAAGKAALLCGLALDVTGHHAADDAIRQEKDRARDEEHRTLAQREQAARAEADQARRRLCDLVDGLDVVLWEADPESDRFTLVSRRAESLFGYPLDRWLNEPGFWTHVIHPDWRQRTLEAYRVAKAAKEDRDLEYQAVAADGRFLWLRHSVHPIRDGDGSLTALRGLMVDLTAHKEEEHRLHREGNSQRERLDWVHGLAGSLDAAVCAVDAAGKLTFVNPAAERLLGWPEKEGLGRDVRSLLPLSSDTTHGKEDPLAAVLQHGRTTRADDLVVTRHDGSFAPIDCTLAPLTMAGRVTGAVLTLRDAGGLKRSAPSSPEVRSYRLGTEEELQEATPPEERVVAARAISAERHDWLAYN